MPQYYNGATRPAIDGIDSSGSGSIAALDHYRNLVDRIFGGDATKVVFGFCISDCSGTGSNANANQAAKVMDDLNDFFPCNGGAFFWVSHHDISGSWSSVVNKVVQPSAGCSGPTPITPSPAPTLPDIPTSGLTCGGGSRGNGICNDPSLCCSEWGCCVTSTAHCSSSTPMPTPAPPITTTPTPPTGATCGRGSRGDGHCANGLCCSKWGWCGTSAAHCNFNP